MTAPIEQTLNVTVAQIEDALLGGQTVPDFAREWSEPPTNVLAVFRRLQREGRIPVNGPAQVSRTPAAPVAGQRSLTSVPTPTTGSALSVDALVNAAARSTSKRTQALGVRLLDLASALRQRLVDEREAAEKAQRQKAEQEAAAAEVARLEEQLREARAKAKLPKGKRNISQASRERLATNAMHAQQSQRVDSPCRKGCAFVAKTTPGRASHERHCTGGAA